MDKLAIFGGPKAVGTSLKPYNSIGKEEADAVKGVIESGFSDIDDALVREMVLV